MISQISIEELYRGEGNGEKYGGGIMGAAIKYLCTTEFRMVMTDCFGWNF